MQQRQLRDEVAAGQRHVLAHVGRLAVEERAGVHDQVRAPAEAVAVVELARLDLDTARDLALLGGERAQPSEGVVVLARRHGHAVRDLEVRGQHVVHGDGLRNEVLARLEEHAERLELRLDGLELVARVGEDGRVDAELELAHAVDPRARLVVHSAEVTAHVAARNEAQGRDEVLLDLERAQVPAQQIALVF